MNRYTTTMEGFTQTVSQLHTLADEAKQAYDNGKLTNGQMLESSRNRIQAIADEIYNVANRVDTGSIVFDNLIKSFITYQIWFDDGWKKYCQGDIRNKRQNEQTWYTYMNSIEPIHYIQLGVNTINSRVFELESFIKGTNKNLQMVINDMPSQLQVMASIQMQVETLKINQSNILTDDYIISLISKAMQDRDTKIASSEKNIHILQDRIEYLISEAIKPKDDEIAALKQRIEVLEKAVNPMPDYDYEMYANHIAPFKDELIIAGRMMSKMYIGRSRLPVATIVSKQ